MLGIDLGGGGVGSGNSWAKGYIPYHHARSYRCKLLDELVKSLAPQLSLTLAKKLLKSLKVTLTAQTPNRAAWTSALTPQAPSFKPRPWPQPGCPSPSPSFATPAASKG